MPFTISHAAVAAPLARRGLVLSAVVVGSMAPDFEYFLTLTCGSRRWHVFPGLLLYALPIALAALWLFHRFLKRPLIRLLPRNHRDRIERLDLSFPFLPARRFALIVASTFVGILSHLVLDAFTHRDGLVVELAPAMSAPVFRCPVGTFAICDFLQFLGTVILSAVLLVQYWRWFARQPAEETGLAAFLDIRRELPLFAAFGTAAAIVAIFLARAHVLTFAEPKAFRTFLEYLIVGSMALFGVQITLFSILIDRFALRSEQHDE